MPLNSSRSNILSPLSQQHAAERFDHLEAAVLSTARLRAVEEVGAAMAHQLNEPLTALLLYLHQIKKDSERPGANSSSILEMTERALRETERVCDIMERSFHIFDAPVDTARAVARGREAIDWLTRKHDTRLRNYASADPSESGQYMLTPREREVLILVTQGASNKEGAYRMGISKRTFEAHRAHIMKKLGARNAADLVRMTVSEIR